MLAACDDVQGQYIPLVCRRRRALADAPDTRMLWQHVVLDASHGNTLDDGPANPPLWLRSLGAHLAGMQLLEIADRVSCAPFVKSIECCDLPGLRHVSTRLHVLED